MNSSRMLNNNNKIKENQQDNHHQLILVQYKEIHKLTFMLGIFVGFFVLRHQVITEFYKWTMNNILGFEIDLFENCIVMREYDDCRPFINCEMCHDIYEIDIIDNQDMTQELFSKKYETSGRPVLIRNAAKKWPALEKFGFQFLKDLNHNSSSIPVLRNEDEDECGFLSWDFDFKNVQVCRKRHDF